MSALDPALVMLAVAFLLALLRIARGPSLADRAVAAEVCLVSVVGAMALLGARIGSGHVLDAVVLATLLQFIAIVALGRLLERKEGP